MITLREVTEISTGHTTTAWKWNGKNEEELLAIAGLDTDSKEFNNRVTTYPHLCWAFFPTERGEVLIRKGGWLVNVKDIGWCSVSGKQLKEHYKMGKEYQSQIYKTEE
jgi:hypothetical protein